MNYGFQEGLSKDFPSQVTVNITEVCNLACVHCPHPQFKHSEHYQARYLDPDLNKKLVDECRGRTNYIRYASEGEPLIHPKAYEMIQYAVDNSQVFVTLTTNGTILNEKRTKKLLDSGIHMIDVSIDAFLDSTYEKIRIGGDLEVTRTNTLRLLEMSNGSKTKVVVSFIKQPLNEAEIADFEGYWVSQNAIVALRNCHSGAGSLSAISEALKKDSEPRRPCVYPWERTKLSPSGHLSFCPADWVHGSKVSDYRTTTIEAEWNGPFYTALRQAHLNNDFEGHRFCGQCPDWKLTQWPGEGKNYAQLVADLAQ